MIGLGQASTLGIGIAIHLDDRFSAGSRRVSAAMSRLGLDSNNLVRDLNNISRVGQGIAAVGDAAFGVAKKGLAAYSSFEKIMTSVAVIGGIKKTDQAYKDLLDQTDRLSEKYGQLPNDIAAANLELAKAGKSVPEIMKLSEAVVTLGAATDTIVGGKNGAAEMLVNTLQAFNKEADQSKYFADVLTSAANRSTIDVTDFYESLKYSSDVANSLYIPIDQVAASIATLGNAGIKGSQAGTAYANMLRYIATGVTTLGTKRQQKVLASLGLTGKDFRNAKGDLKDLGGIFEMLKEKTSKLNSPDKLAALTALTGVRGERGLYPLMMGMTKDENGNDIQTYKKMYADITKDVRNGIAESTAAARLDTLAGDEAKFKTSFARFYIAIGKAMAPIVRPLLQIMTKVMNFIADIADSPVGAWLIRSGLLLTMSLSVFGRVLSYGARLVGFMTTSSGIFTSGMKTGLMMAEQIKLLLLSASEGFAFNMRSAGGPGAFGRTSTGAPSPIPMGQAGFMKSNWLSRMMGWMGGMRGVKWVGGLFRKMGWLIPIIEKLGIWFIKGGGWIKALGAGLGKVLGWLFGWEFMIFDLAWSFIFGKSVFETLWNIIKWVGNIFVKIGDWFSNLDMWGWLKGLFITPAGGNNPNDPTYKNGNGYKVPDSINKTYNNTMNTASGTPIQLNVSVHPTTGDKKTEHKLNINTQRALTGQGFKIN